MCRSAARVSLTVQANLRCLGVALSPSGVGRPPPPAQADSSVGWVVDSISPQVLSTKMLGVSKYNLNLISYDSAIGMVNAAIAAGVNVSELYVDTVGDAERYTEKRAPA